MNEMLSGIKVLDFGQYIAGPLAAMMLAEQGAEVIKIERPQGDPFRKKDGFMVWNRSKKNIVLDLTRPEGQEIALDLIKDADVIIENFRPGVMEKLGLSYERIQAINPRIIYCSISGFGDSGPYTRIPGYEQLVSSLSTIYAEQGYATRPTYVLLPLASSAAGLDAAYSIVAALCVREGTGQGQKIEATLFNSALSINRDKALNFPGVYRYHWLPTGTFPFYRIYKCADGKHLFLGLGNFKFVTMFVLLIEREDWLVGDLLDGAPFGMLPPKAGMMVARLKDIFLTKTRDEWLELLLPNGIPVAPIQTIDDYMEYGQVKANGLVVTVKQPGKGMAKEVGIPIKPSLTPGSIKGPSALPGQHTAEILTRLGYSSGDIKKLKRDGIVRISRRIKK